MANYVFGAGTKDEFFSIHVVRGWPRINQCDRAKDATDEVPYQSGCVQGSNPYNSYKGCMTAMSFSLGAVFANFAHRATMERAPA